jgi:hypothetical protein
MGLEGAFRQCVSGAPVAPGDRRQALVFPEALPALRVRRPAYRLRCKNGTVRNAVATRARAVRYNSEAAGILETLEDGGDT